MNAQRQINITDTFCNMNDLEEYSNNTVEQKYFDDKVPMFDMLFRKQDYKELISKEWKQIRKNYREKYQTEMDNNYDELDSHFENFELISHRHLLDIKELIEEEKFIYKNSIIPNKKRLMEKLDEMFYICLFTSKFGNYISTPTNKNRNYEIWTHMRYLDYNGTIDDNYYGHYHLSLLDKIEKKYKKDETVQHLLRRIHYLIEMKKNTGDEEDYLLENDESQNSFEQKYLNNEYHFFNNNKNCAKIGDLIIKHIAIANLLMTKLGKYKNENFYYNFNRKTLLVKKVYPEELEDFIKIKYNFWVGYLRVANLTH